MSVLMRGGGGPNPQTLGEMRPTHSLFRDLSRQASRPRPLSLSCPPTFDTFSRTAAGKRDTCKTSVRHLDVCKIRVLFKFAATRASRQLKANPALCVSPPSGVVCAIHAFVTELT